jgi:peroxiredoxin
VSVDPPEASEALRQRLGAGITFLSDPNGMLMDPLNVRHRAVGPTTSGGKPGDLFMPTTFLLDENHVVRWVYRPDTYRVRAPASEVLEQIDRLG